MYGLRKVILLVGFTTINIVSGSFWNWTPPTEEQARRIAVKKHARDQRRESLKQSHDFIMEQQVLYQQEQEQPKPGRY